MFEGGVTSSQSSFFLSPGEGMTGQRAVPDSQGRSENPSGANTANLLLFQKTPQIYSVELNGAKDMEQTDEGGGKKYRGLLDNCLALRKNHRKEGLRKEVDLVSGLGP